MKEKLVLDYMKANDIKLYKDSDKLHYLTFAGEYVIVTEESDCLNYREQHMMPTIDIMAWMYSLVLEKTI